MKEKMQSGSFVSPEKEVGEADADDDDAQEQLQSQSRRKEVTREEDQQ